VTVVGLTARAAKTRLTVGVSGALSAPGSSIVGPLAEGRTGCAAVIVRPAALIVVRLQTVMAREVDPTDPAVLTVGSIQAGTKSSVIDDHAVLQLNVRTCNDRTRGAILDAVKRKRRAGASADSDDRLDRGLELAGRLDHLGASVAFGLRGVCEAGSGGLPRVGRRLGHQPSIG
jgi:acetylornithine deacetylase/succinyl-diaminopimelate desuccinylase-like protein